MPKQKTYAQLARQNLELIAGLISVHKTAISNLPKASVARRMGSGVLLQLTGVGGEDIIPPVMIRDGLSDETIAALPDHAPSLRAQKRSVAMAFADKLVSTNPRFDRERFLLAALRGVLK